MQEGATENRLGQLGSLYKYYYYYYYYQILYMYFSVSPYAIMSVLTLHFSDLLSGAFYLFHLYVKIKKKKTIEDLNIHQILHYKTLYYIIFIFIEKNAYLGTLNIILWSLCYPRLRDGVNILCKASVYLSQRVAF